MKPRGRFSFVLKTHFFKVSSKARGSFRWRAKSSFLSPAKMDHATKIVIVSTHLIPYHGRASLRDFEIQGNASGGTFWRISLTLFSTNYLYSLYIPLIQWRAVVESVQQNTSLILTNGSRAERTRVINLDSVSDAKSSILGRVCFASHTTLDCLIDNWTRLLDSFPHWDKQLLHKPLQSRLRSHIFEVKLRSRLEDNIVGSGCIQLLTDLITIASTSKKVPRQEGRPNQFLICINPERVSWLWWTGVKSNQEDRKTWPQPWVQCACLRLVL